MNTHSVNEYSFIIHRLLRCVIKKQDKTDKFNNDKYHQILNAAIKIFAEQGYHNSTISQVAREAGVADGTIYIYFKNKADILFNFFSYKTRRVFDQFKEAVDKADHAEDKLRNLIRRHFDEFQQDPNMAVVFQREALQARYIEEAYIKDITKMYLDIIGDIFTQGHKKGSIRKDFPTGLGKRLILGAVNEVINTWVVAGIKYDLVTMADPLVDLFFKGIGAREQMVESPQTGMM